MREKPSLLITGITGYVGNILYHHLKHKYTIYGLSRRAHTSERCFSCDTRYAEELKELSTEIQPDIIIFASGNKNLKYCEEHPDDAYTENCLSVQNLLEVFPKSLMIYLSSDYVFDGVKGHYVETDQPQPSTVYGRSKWEAEQKGCALSERFKVLRLSALFDSEATFPKFLREQFESQMVTECYDDTFYSPTYYKDFVRVIEAIIEQEPEEKIFHACGERVSRYEFALLFAEAFDYSQELVKEDSIKGKRGFLYPDLSLNNEQTCKILGVQQTSLRQALIEIAGK